MNENQKIDNRVNGNFSAQLPPIFITNRRVDRDNDIDFPIAPMPPIPAPPGPEIPAPNPDQTPVFPIPPYVPEYPLPAPPSPDQTPVIPLPPYVPGYPLPAPPTPIPPTTNDRITINARYLLDYMGLYLDGLKAAYTLSVNQPRATRDEIKAIRNRAYILYDDATQIVGRLPIALQQNRECPNCRIYQDGLRQSLKYGRLALKRIVNLIYLNGNRAIDAQLLTLYIRLNEDLKNIQDLL
ncbi:MAG: hypothetical protein RR458_01525 [Clostridia bacterium]